MEKLAPWNDPEVRWVCEEHPTKDQSHRLWFGFGKECGGAGMPEETQTNIDKGYIAAIEISPAKKLIDHQMNMIRDNASLSIQKPFSNK